MTITEKQLQAAMRAYSSEGWQGMRAGVRAALAAAEQSREPVGDRIEQNRREAAMMASAASPVPPAAPALPMDGELPDDLRTPLHSLQADIDWLVARIIAEDDEARDMCKDSIRKRLSQIEAAAYRLTYAIDAKAPDAGDYAGDRLDPFRKFALGQRVRKVKGAYWQGPIVGYYSTALTPIGYAVESEAHAGSVQIYPEVALELAPVTPRTGDGK